VPATRAALYLRVSNLDQTPETLNDLRQTATLRGYQIIREYADRSSGSKAKHPNLDQLVSDARSGNFTVLVVESLSELGGSVKGCLSVLTQLLELGIGFISCQPAIDTTDATMGQGIAVTIRALSELERTLRIANVKAGMQRSKLQGMLMGRRPLEVDRTAIVRDRLSGMSLTNVGKRHGVSRAMVCRLVKLAGGQPEKHRPYTGEPLSLGVSA
jgi:DNA invertase Pin-like site-specific DNA recombinase